ncbi:nodulation protein NodH [Frigidibacter sp. RF13]|uniref:nodulation protein NodH n=1 Tax=Frigidibacter sp. RF13 TaxID=2997340 RepID=UPI00226E4CB7|nr:nodulation protein NodH [Frigidibacter sp. RF13]MCY1128404.1 nodulation protein NodH [Frigidibacter sp. RF13]
MARFTSFVILAAMRTGSNFLEESLKGVPGLAVHGEAFNPVFMGHADQKELLGLSLAARDADPGALLDRLRKAPGLNGFRLFPGHDPRVLALVLADPACAKIVLTRNPAESYVSLLIARATDQWKLGDARGRREARVRFEEAGFHAHLSELGAFRSQVTQALQASGQTAFHLTYDDLGDREVICGLCRFLGVDGEAAEPARSIVPQNPGPLSDKVTNPREMAATLARLDPFGLSQVPNFEAGRGPQVPSFIAAQVPLLFLPIPGGPSASVERWLSAFGPTETGFTQKTLKDWMRGHTGLRRFTVLRHPLLRAFAAFESYLGPEFDEATRQQISRNYKVASEPTATAFAAFLRFLKANLNGQTAHRTLPGWASQSAVVQGFQQLFSPDLVAREDRVEPALGYLCEDLGLPMQRFEADDGLAQRLRSLGQGEVLSAAARQGYARDYLAFGFGDWA